MIKSLQSLRFIFAIMIFLHHFPYNGEGLFAAGGPLGVCFFIMLSGFVMSAGYGERVMSEKFEFKKYFLKRIIRLWPLHLLCLFAFIALYFPQCLSSVKQIGVLGINALMLQSWIPMKIVYFSGNAVSWCLCDLMFCYVMFPLLFRLISKTSSKVLALASFLVVTLYIVVIQLIPDKSIHAFVYISPLFRILDFAIGIIAYKLYERLCDSSVKNYVQKSSRFTLSCVEVSVIAILVGCVFLYPNIAEKYNLSLMWWPVCMVTILTFSLLDTFGGGCLSLLMQNKLLQRISVASFTFYMIHQLAITGLMKLFNIIPLNIPYVIEVIVCLILITIAAIFVNIYFEKPISAYLSKKI